MTNPEDFTTRFTGELYDADLDGVEIAKRIRKALKDTGFRASVRLQRYAGGQTINITVKEVVSVEAKRAAAKAAIEHRDDIADRPGSREFESCYRYQVEQTVCEIASAWRKSETNSMTDYYSCNYYVSAHAEMGDDQ